MDICVYLCVKNNLIKLIYETTYESVKRSKTDPQIGAQKHKGVRNHLFILNIHHSDVMSSIKKEPIDLAIWTLNKCLILNK